MKNKHLYKKYKICTLCFALILAIAGGWQLAMADKPAAKPKPPKVHKVPPAGVYKVLHIVDGDTIDIGVPLADGSLLSCRIREAKIDTPERGQPGYKEATEAMRKLAGEKVRIAYVAGKRKRGRYGRLLCELFTLDGTNIGQKLLADGHAKKYEPRRRPKLTYKCRACGSTDIEVIAKTK